MSSLQVMGAGRMKGGPMRDGGRGAEGVHMPRGSALKRKGHPGRAGRHTRSSWLKRVQASKARSGCCSLAGDSRAAYFAQARDWLYDSGRSQHYIRLLLLPPPSYPASYKKIKEYHVAGKTHPTSFKENEAHKTIVPYVCSPSQTRRTELRTRPHLAEQPWRLDG